MTIIKLNLEKWLFAFGLIIVLFSNTITSWIINIFNEYSIHNAAVITSPLRNPYVQTMKVVVSTGFLVILLSAVICILRIAKEKRWLKSRGTPKA